MKPSYVFVDELPPGVTILPDCQEQPRLHDYITRAYRDEMTKHLRTVEFKDAWLGTHESVIPRFYSQEYREVLERMLSEASALQELPTLIKLLPYQDAHRKRYQHLITDRATLLQFHKAVSNALTADILHRLRTWKKS